MKFFVLRPDEDTGSWNRTEAVGEPEFFGRRLERWNPEEVTFDVGHMQAKLNDAIKEAGQWFSSKVEGLPERVHIDSVTVELGVTFGGEIGVFAKGRADIAGSINVTLKVTA